MPKEEMDMKGMGWRVSLSILVSLGWLAFLVIWLFFYAGDFSLYQNIAIFLVSVIVVVAIMGASWAPWGMKHGKHGGWEECCPPEKKRPARKRKR